VADFREVNTDVVLLAGDTLTMRPSAKYQGFVHRMVWNLYPRGIIQRYGRRFGLGLLIEAVK
jgi:hypothetical protein